MTILKSGTPTGFQDKNGVEIKTADRIKHVVDGSICVIDKFARAVSPLGFKYELTSLNCSRGMNPDGTCFAKLTDYELTDEEPPKPKGESVRPGDDAENMVPDRFRDPAAARPRHRATKSEMKARKDARYNVLAEIQPYIDKLAAAGHDIAVIAPEAQFDPVRIELDGCAVTYAEIKNAADAIDIPAVLEAVQDPDDARKMLALQDYQDEDLCDELRARGFHGEIRRVKTIMI